MQATPRAALIPDLHIFEKPFVVSAPPPAEGRLCLKI